MKQLKMIVGTLLIATTIATAFAEGSDMTTSTLPTSSADGSGLGNSDLGILVSGDEPILKKRPVNAEVNLEHIRCSFYMDHKYRIDFKKFSLGEIRGSWTKWNKYDTIQELFEKAVRKRDLRYECERSVTPINYLEDLVALNRKYKAKFYQNKNYFVSLKTLTVDGVSMDDQPPEQAQTYRRVFAGLRPDGVTGDKFGGNFKIKATFKDPLDLERLNLAHEAALFYFRERELHIPHHFTFAASDETFIQPLVTPFEVKGPEGGSVEKLKVPFKISDENQLIYDEINRFLREKKVKRVYDRIFDRPSFMAQIYHSVENATSGAFLMTEIVGALVPFVEKSELVQLISDHMISRWHDPYKKDVYYASHYYDFSEPNKERIKEILGRSRFGMELNGLSRDCTVCRYESNDLTSMESQRVIIENGLTVLRSVYPRNIDEYSREGCPFVPPLMAALTELNNRYLVFIQGQGSLAVQHSTATQTSVSRSIEILQFLEDQKYPTERTPSVFLQTVLPNWQAVCSEDEVDLIQMEMDRFMLSAERGDL